MGSFKERMIRFMQGRYLAYGYDTLTRFLLIVWLILTVITSFFGNAYIRLLPLALFFYIYFRLFSRNISARYRENEAFRQMTAGIRGRFSKMKRRALMHKSYHIYRCPQCAQKIRVPRGRGRIEVTCPKCGDKFLKVS